MLSVKLQEVMAGRTATVRVEPTATVAQFAEMAAKALQYDVASHIQMIQYPCTVLKVTDGRTLQAAGFKDGDVVKVLANFRGAGGIMSAPLEGNVAARRKEAMLRDEPVIGSKIYAVQRSGGGDRQEALALQYSEDEQDVLYAGGGPDQFQLDSGGGLRVRGVEGFDALVGKTIEALEYREWRKKGPGPPKAKRAEHPSGSGGSKRPTGAVLLFEGGASIFAVKDAAGAEPASITWIGCEGEEGGCFEPGYPAD